MKQTGFKVFAQVAPSGKSADNLKLVLGSHSPSELKCINDLILKEIFKKLEQASLAFELGAHKMYRFSAQHST